MGSLNTIFLIILPIFINQFVLNLPVVAKYVLSQGDILDTTSTLVSPGGSFTLGFFTIDPSTGFNYLGIWYTNDGRKVWVANRDKPMISSGLLMIDKSGTLKVIANTTFFNISNQVGSGNTTAVLEDSGNLVVYDVANGNRSLWQSFDHPTDTLLPGMKLGYNLTTGQNLTLTSWLTDQIPASGAFTLRLEQIENSTQLVIYRRGKLYWSSGPWVDERFGFEFLPSSNNYFGPGVLVSDASGKYFAIQTHGISGVSMLQLSYMGDFLFGGGFFIRWGICYNRWGYDGCAISALPYCRRRQSDSFELTSGNWYGDFIQIDNSSNISLSDCMESCWNDCNCKGFSTYRDALFWVEMHKLIIILILRQK